MKKVMYYHRVRGDYVKLRVYQNVDEHTIIANVSMYHDSVLKKKTHKWAVIDKATALAVVYDETRNKCIEHYMQQAIQDAYATTRTIDSYNASKRAFNEFLETKGVNN